MVSLGHSELNSNVTVGLIFVTTLWFWCLLLWWKLMWNYWLFAPLLCMYFYSLTILLNATCLGCHSWFRADSRLAPSQWETLLLCNDISHWLGANLELALSLYDGSRPSLKNAAECRGSQYPKEFCKMYFTLAMWKFTCKTKKKYISVGYDFSTLRWGR